MLDTLLDFEAVAATLCFATLAFGLTLRYTPAIATAMMSKAYTGWLPARERLEASGWHAIVGGRTQGIARVTYRIEEAAKLAGISQPDTGRAIATTQLVIMMQNPSTETVRITPGAARELYDIEKEILRDEVLASKIKSFLDSRSDLSSPRQLFTVPPREALKAALDLTDTNLEQVDTPERPLWFHLVAVACADAGLVSASDIRKRLGAQAEHTAAGEAYSRAKEKLRSRTFEESWRL